jgi:hypothetical protein
MGMSVASTKLRLMVAAGGWRNPGFRTKTLFKPGFIFCKPIENKW